ncbi:hypothetical protein [Aurantibacter sp.]|uniref:hypothetical protein n=1 Tax=Aurantibacter sp. TaxID=2807103 RepID=UPI003266F133
MKTLIASYKGQFKLMSDKTLSDEEKQKQLMQLVSEQIKLLGKLIFGILLFVAPFLSLFFLQKISARLNPDILITWWGLLIPIITVIIYLFIKKNYGRLFSNR